MNTWTVKQLREKLAEFPDDFYVYTEGCDCIGGVGDVTKEANLVQREGYIAEGTVLINRPPEAEG